MVKKAVALLLVLSFTGILLTSCNTHYYYDKPMYRRLSNPELYDEFSMIVKGFEYYDADTRESKEAYYRPCSLWRVGQDARDGWRA